MRRLNQPASPEISNRRGTPRPMLPPQEMLERSPIGAWGTVAIVVLAIAAGSATLLWLARRSRRPLRPRTIEKNTWPAQVRPAKLDALDAWATALLAESRGEIWRSRTIEELDRRREELDALGTELVDRYVELRRQVADARYRGERIELAVDEPWVGWARLWEEALRGDRESQGSFGGSG